MVEPALFRHLSSCKRVLIAGAGGGFDVFAALPLAHALWSRLVDAPSPMHVSLLIEDFRNDLKPRPPRVIPH